VTATQLRDCLQPVLPKDVLLVSDGAAAYRRFAADAGIMHEAVNVQNVNGWHSRFETWLVRFKKAQPTRTQPFYWLCSRLFCEPNRVVEVSRIVELPHVE
jgi:hypothetical protein